MKFRFKCCLVVVLFCLFVSFFSGLTVYAQGSSVVAEVGQPFYEPVSLTGFGQDGYDYKAEGEVYRWYVKAHSNWGDCNKYVVAYEGTEYYLVYQAQDYSFRDVYGAQDYIGSISDRVGVVNGSTIRYNGVFSYVDLEYQTFYGMLKERFIIHQLPRQPASYLKAPITLDFGGYVKFGNLKVFVNGIEKTGTSFVTGERIDFGLDNETILFYLPKPFAEDAVGSRVDCLYEVKLQGNQIWFYVRTPFEWLNDSARVYPVIVDPSIVGTSTTSYAVSYPCQRKSFYANGRFWVFYSDGANMVYRTSTDGVNWSNATTVRTCAYGYRFPVWFDGTYVHYAYAASTAIYYRRGTPNSDGTITWSASEQTVSTAYNRAAYPFVSVDSYGYVWIGYQDYDGSSYFPYVIRSGNNDGTWGTTPNGFPYQLSTTSNVGWCVSVVPLTNGKMLVVYAYSGAVVRVRCWNGNGWNTEVTTTSLCRNGYSISVVAEGDDADIVFLKSTGYDILHVRYTYSTNSLSTEHTVIAGATSTSAPVLCRDYTSDTLYVFWATKTSNSPSGATANHIYYQTSTDDGATWSSPVDWIDESSEVLYAADRLTCFYQAYNGYVGLLYVTKTASPYNVKFAYLTLAVGKTWHDIAAWTLQLFTRQWNLAGTWTLTLNTLGWHDITAWTLQLLTRNWQDIAQWNIQLITRAWQNIATWIEQLITCQWNPITVWTILLEGPPAKIWRDIATWIINLQTRTWHDIAAWTWILQTRQWHNIAQWTTTIITRTWQTITQWTTYLGKIWVDVVQWSMEIIYPWFYDPKMVLAVGTVIFTSILFFIKLSKR